MSYKFKSKAQGLPVNIIVTLIIGIIIFSLGLAMFSKISGASTKEIEDLNSRVKSNIEALECSGGDWICVSSCSLKNGDQNTCKISIANKADDRRTFMIDFPNGADNSIIVKKEGCGSITIRYPSTIEMSIESSMGGSIPFIVKADKVKKKGCSFITSVVLKDIADSTFEEKTSVIIKVE